MVKETVARAPVTPGKGLSMTSEFVMVGVPVANSAPEYEGVLGRIALALMYTR